METNNHAPLTHGAHEDLIQVLNRIKRLHAKVVEAQRDLHDAFMDAFDLQSRIQAKPEPAFFVAIKDARERADRLQKELDQKKKELDG